MAASREPFNVLPHSAAPAAHHQQLQHEQHSPWHSPVPYLFGGLAAMLGLIAFALLILACSYWKLSGYLDGGDSANREPDLEAAGDDTQKQASPVFEEKILVIMAGEMKPTYLATPMSSRSSSFGDTKSNSSCGSKGSSTGDKEEKSVGLTETVKHSTADQEKQSIENRETPESSDPTTH
ncbi:protein GLUTAMINE DUMPER 3 [Cucumis melo var. makuwa]|uniref:Protein GLUTAMINE DUMPER 3 n=3 Tax=Cucumis melo TaxID=3656 RepID=A0A5D3CGH8_CUCMM|nr:protein GLUTAMINE DUMPER 2 [Cucumis melo]KAA0064000.1 protein GLUTAMINE DUMPER 3 [Cucumis melo var. makuwa]TYK09476.1 protein GLUTAMINE DUMPER 3 [Cucumis melo var. makuwa]